MSNEIRKGAIKYLLIIFFQRIVGIALFFIAAGTFYDIRGVVNLSLYLFASIVISIIMFFKHQETLNERGKKQENTKNWDKILLTLIVLLVFYGIYFVAGLGVRFELATLAIEWFYIGTILYLISCVFGIWPVLENKYFESSSRIQSNRNQTVITTGPYKIVRHPGYAGTILWAVASALMFGTFVVGIISVIIIVIFIIRTFLEDRMLKEELLSYSDYSKIVKYRLIPFIW